MRNLRNIQRKGRKTAALLCLVLLLAACGSKEYESAEDYIQLNPDAQTEEDTLGTDVAQEEEDADASGASKQDIASDEAEDADTEDSAADTSAAQEDDTSAAVHGELWEKAMRRYRSYLADHDDEYTAFWPVDINNDGVPELLTKGKTENELSTFIPYTDAEGGSVETVEGNTIHDIDGWYYPGTGVFMLDDALDDEGYYYFPPNVNSLSEWTDNTHIGSLYSHHGGNYVWLGIWENDGRPYKEGTVSKERFEELLEELTGGVEKVDFPSIDECYENTEENREAYLK